MKSNYLAHFPSILVGLLIAMPFGGLGAPSIANSSFEIDTVPPFPTYGPISDWSSSGSNVGVNTSAGPFWDNGAITSGTKCAFIQQVYSLTQNVPGFDAATQYDFRVRVNARASTPLQPRIQVTVGTTVVIPSTAVVQVGGAAGTGNPFTQLTVVFASPGAGTHPVKIENLEGGGDNTLLLDEVEIVPHIAAARNWDLLY